eukprot:1286869-Amphidinium_carterae.1
MADPYVLLVRNDARSSTSAMWLEVPSSRVEDQRELQIHTGARLEYAMRPAPRWSVTCWW